MITTHGINGNYAWSDRAFARRCINLIDSRGFVTLAQAQTALTAMPFTAGGWTTLKKIVAELILGSVAFPSDLLPGGVGLANGLTEDQLGTRDVSSTIT